MSAHDDEPRTRPFRWAGPCSGCRREDDLETHYDHGARALCDRCAARPPRPPLATPDPALADVSDDQLRRMVEAAWDADTAAPMPAPPRRAPDWISRTLARLERAGLPVDGLGIPGLAVSACPACGAPMSVRFHGDQLVDLVCVAGCGEADIARLIAARQGATR